MIILTYKNARGHRYGASVPRGPPLLFIQDKQHAIWSAYGLSGGSLVSVEFLKKFTKSQQHPRASRAVPHPSTDRAFGGLSSEFEWDREFSTEYGRWREGLFAEGPWAATSHQQGGAPRMSAQNERPK